MQQTRDRELLLLVRHARDDGSRVVITTGTGRHTQRRQREQQLRHRVDTSRFTTWCRQSDLHAQSLLRRHPHHSLTRLSRASLLQNDTQPAKKKERIHSLAPIIALSPIVVGLLFCFACLPGKFHMNDELI